RRVRIGHLRGRRQGGAARGTHRRSAHWPASRGRGGGRGRFAVGHRRRGLHEGSPRVGPRRGGACADARRDGGDPGHARRDRGGRRVAARRTGRLAAVPGPAHPGSTRGAAAVRAFGSPSFLLSDARFEVRVAYTGFLLLAAIGMATMAALQWVHIGPTPGNIASYFRGGSGEGAMTFPKTARGLIDPTHFHAFA